MLPFVVVMFRPQSDRSRVSLPSSSCTSRRTEPSIEVSYCRSLSLGVGTCS
jgi:hypothetical protein